MGIPSIGYGPGGTGGFAPDVAGRGFFGKFRAKVTDNLDPLGKGRLRVSAPDVLEDDDLGWALPAVPYAGDGVGIFFLPSKGANVWVEFEQGDPDHPIWTGCFWSDPAVDLGGPSPPASPAVPYTKVLKTDAVTITIQDAPGVGGLTIETNGMKLVMNALGVEITTKVGASVKLQGPKVSINNTALEVT
jgi:hypothetical protein